MCSDFGAQKNKVGAWQQFNRGQQWHVIRALLGMNRVLQGHPDMGTQKKGYLCMWNWGSCRSSLVRMRRDRSKGKSMKEVLGWKRSWRVWRSVWLQDRSQGTQFSATQMWDLFLWDPTSWLCGCESWTIKKAEAFKLCGAGEDSWLSFGQQGDQTSQS